MKALFRSIAYLVSKSPYLVGYPVIRAILKRIGDSRASK